MKEKKLSKAMMTVKKFNSLGLRDFENGAVRDEIRSALKERESLIESSGEPSEAEVEELVKKEAKVWGHFSPRQKEIVKDFIFEVIREYDQLRKRRG